ncbi:MAG: hypothetical protein Q7T41_00935 [Candidatus Saccharibacteria bacterium]|nr:hypothetical protein [Candidatus Saccharibacteria bacterium]
MGSFIEINDTLRINKEQGFPDFLDINVHLKTPFALKDIEGKVFSFKDKPDIRIYKIPPVRNFLVEEVDGKWIYWGLCHVLSIEHDYINKTTSGTFKIIYINSPEEMKSVFELTDQRDEVNYF